MGVNCSTIRDENPVLNCTTRIMMGRGQLKHIDIYMYVYICHYLPTIAVCSYYLVMNNVLVLTVIVARSLICCSSVSQATPHS
jgi:hypothetical protein